VTNTVHVVPLGDLIDHNSDSADCVCGPRVEPVECDDGSIGWLVVHHSLDGRELDEPDHDDA
jgi:hypothetical protein